MNFLSSECSLLMLTILSVVRFRCIDKIGGLRRIEGTIVITVIISWALSAIFGLSYLGFLSLTNLKVRHNMCVLFIIFHSHYVHNIEYYFQITYVAFYVMCLAVLFASSVGLFNAIMKSSRSLTKLEGNIKGYKKKAHSQIVKIGLQLVLLVTCNAICWIPILVVSILVLIDVKMDEQILQWMVTLVVPLGATIDPVLYNMQLFKNSFQRFTCKT